MNVICAGFRLEFGILVVVGLEFLNREFPGGTRRFLLERPGFPFLFLVRELPRGPPLHIPRDFNDLAKIHF